MPKVSVLMCVYNGEAWLAEAIDSVLAQSFHDFELVLVDDASDDGTAAILDSYGDTRLKRFRNKENIGLTRSLNVGLKECAGDYIARLDADDVALPERLERQVAFLESHPGIGVVGSDALLIDGRGIDLRRSSKPQEDLELRWTALWSTPFLHSTVMMRRDVLEEHNLAYDPAYRTAQDLDLWYRLLQVTKGANMPEALVKRRWHHEAISVRNVGQQKSDRNDILRKNMNGFLGEEVMSLEDVTLIRQVLEGPFDADRSAARRSMAKFVRMLGVFARRHKGEEDMRVLYFRQIKFITKRLIKILGVSGISAFFHREKIAA